MADNTPDESQSPPTPAAADRPGTATDRPGTAAPSGPTDNDRGTGNGDRLVLPDWLRTREPELPTTWHRRLRDRLGDHGVKTVALVIMVAIFVPFGWMIWDVWVAPPGTPSYVSGVNAYAGTPAATYHSGEAGIKLPEARATTSFSTDQVSQGLSAVRQALVAARLDPRMLTGHEPDGFLALLAPASRSELAADFTDRTGPGYVSRMSTAIPLLDEVEPRVKGLFTYREVRVNGAPVLEITSSFTWVYPFDTRCRPPAGTW